MSTASAETSTVVVRFYNIDDRMIKEYMLPFCHGESKSLKTEGAERVSISFVGDTDGSSSDFESSSSSQSSQSSMEEDQEKQ